VAGGSFHVINYATPPTTGNFFLRIFANDTNEMGRLSKDSPRRHSSPRGTGVGWRVAHRPPCTCSMFCSPSILRQSRGSGGDYDSGHVPRRSRRGTPHSVILLNILSQISTNGGRIFCDIHVFGEGVSKSILFCNVDGCACQPSMFYAAMWYHKLV
jgi:hypothetical protein